jgi:hypothetical protein
MTLTKCRSEQGIGRLTGKVPDYFPQWKKTKSRPNGTAGSRALIQTTLAEEFFRIQREPNVFEHSTAGHLSWCNLVGLFYV